MKNYSKILSVFVMTALLAVSCELDRFPYDSIEQSQAFKTVKDATTLNNGLYAQLRGRLYGIFMFSTDVQADLLNATGDYGNRNGFPHKWTGFLADDYTIRDTWSPYYGALVNINNFIDNADVIVPTTAADSTLMSKYMGEAYFLRAFYYHQLVQRWAKDYEPATAETDLGVPLVLKFDVTLLPSRATVKQVYDQILDDLSEAKTYLASVAGAQNSAKITRDCVTALEAQVHLCMHNWTDAVTAADALITSGTYPLISNAANFKSMWVNDGGTETIFQPFFSQPSELGNANSIYLGFNSALNKYVPDFVPQQWVVDMYENTDIRKNAYLEQKLLYIQGVNYPNIWLINKYPGNPALFTTAVTNYMHKPKVFRIAEMYLISAEAAAMTPATEGAALARLNELRTARGISTLTGLTGTVLRDSIRVERTRELLCEGKRLDDLKRWNLGFTRTAPQNIGLIVSSPAEDFHTKTVAAGADKFVWGIPTRDITANPNIASQQNPGW